MSEENKLMTQVAEGLEGVQKRLDSHGEKLDGIDQAVIAKATEDCLKAMDGLQAIETERKAEKEEADKLVKRLEDMELSLSKGGGAAEEGENLEYKQAMGLYLRKGVAPDSEINETIVNGLTVNNLIGATDSEKEMYVKAMVAATGPDGGYFIQNDRASFMSKRIFETSPLRGIANTVTTTSDMFEIILDDDEASAGWVGEVQARPETDTPKIGLIKIPVHELYANPKATQKMLDDAGFNLEAWLTDKITRKFGRLENTSFVVGDGSQKPKGFLSYAAWAAAGVYERDAVEQIVATGTAGSLTDGDDIVNLQNALIEDYQAGATWGMKRATFGEVMQLKDTQGQYILHSRFLNEGAEKVLLGSPVVFMNDIPATATDALSVVYADFQEFYTIVDRFGVRVLRDPYTAKPYVLFYSTKRTGGAVTNYEAGKLLKIN